MNLEVGELRYAWHEWAAPPTTGIEWAHHGLAATADDRVVAWDQAARELLVSDAGTGRPERRLPVAAVCGHGLTVADDAGRERVWIADTGEWARLDGDRVLEEAIAPRVLAVDLAGDVVQELSPPPTPIYRSEPYRPTGITMAEQRRGGDGSIWVADGYGASLVHRFDRAGRHTGVIDGESAGLRFDCPHDVFVDWRHAEPELLVADRGNQRVQAFDLDGGFRRTIGLGELSSPSAFATVGDALVVAELRSRLAVLDADDRLVGYLGDGGDVWQTDGWPNAGDGTTVEAPTDLHAGRFRSPHGLTALSDGTILVAEWLIGGRVIRLAPL